MNLWAVQLHSHNRLDGDTKHIVYESSLPKLFRTRRECRAYIKERFGYIRERADLRKEPHGWRVPQVIKVALISLLPEKEKHGS